MLRDRRIPSLDGLRGLAASAVIYAHIEFFYPTTNHWLTLDTGNAAVAIFFSLSGFLMAVLYGDRKFDATDYLVHRFARIYPVYIVSVLVVIALSAIFRGAYLYPIEGSVQIARHIAMIGSTGVYWSIPPEIQFYLFFLLIWLWFLDPRKFQWVAVLSAAFLVVAGYFGFAGPGILLTSKLPYFLFGTLAGRMFAKQTHPLAGNALVGIVTLGLIVFFFLSPGFFPETLPFWGLTSALTGAVIVYLAACGSSVSDFVLASRPLRFVGKISFSLYLFHLPVIFLGMHFLNGHMLPEVALAISIAISYLVAWLSYLVIEDPARRLLTDAWRTRKQRLPVAAE
jgi:peptidoglycan/LPS O-acetylase OafA/YrhL